MVSDPACQTHTYYKHHLTKLPTALTSKYRLKYIVVPKVEIIK